MIKFNCLIHKGIGTVIEYSKWWQLIRKEAVENKEELTYFGNGEKYYKYKLKEMLFSDDFEIIYDSEFTTEELNMIYSCIGVTINEYECSDCSCEEEYNLLDKIEKVKNKYRIEV
jgi:hypothetical protein